MKVELFQNVGQYLQDHEVSEIQKAVFIAEKIHKNHQLDNATSHLDHSIDTAIALAKWSAPYELIISALLHQGFDPKKEFNVSIHRKTLDALFSQRIGDIVRQANILNMRIQQAPHRAFTNVESIAYRLPHLIQIIEHSPHSLFILFASYNSRLSSNFLSEAEQNLLIQGAQNFLIPFASGLGMYEFKRQLENNVFRLLNNSQHSKLASYITESNVNDKIKFHIHSVVERLLLEKDISGKIKSELVSTESLYRKSLEKFSIEHIFLNIPTVIIAKNVSDCYCIKEALLSFPDWETEKFFFDDYIQNPKKNAYQSLHLRFLHPTLKGEFQIFIRTESMDNIARFGVLNDWVGLSQNLFQNWVSQLKSFSKSAAQLSHKDKRIVVYSKDGDAYFIKQGATCLDLAYYIHTELGNQFSWAYINGIKSTSDQQLVNGDVVKVVANMGQVPDSSWLDIVKTKKAKRAILNFLRKEDLIQQSRPDRFVRSKLTIRVDDVPDMLVKILNTVSGINVFSCNAEQLYGQLSIIHLEVNSSPQELNQVISKVKSIEGVHNAEVGEVLSTVQRENPYNITSPASSKVFTGRDKDLHRLISNLRGIRAGEGVLLWGAKRVGKTSLLSHLKNVLVDQDFFPVQINMERLSGFPISRFLSDLFNEIDKQTPFIKLEIPSARQVLKNPFVSMNRLFEQIRRNDAKIILLIDEFQLLSKLKDDIDNSNSQNIYRYFRDLIQFSENVSIIFCGGGIYDDLFHHEALSSMLQVVRVQEVKLLPKEESQRLITNPVKHRLQYSQSAIDRLVILTNGHPYYLTLLCHQLVEQSDMNNLSNISEKLLEEILESWALTYEQQNHYLHMWGTNSGASHDQIKLFKLLLSGIAFLQNGTNNWVSYDSVSELDFASNSKVLEKHLSDLVSLGALIRSTSNDSQTKNIDQFKFYVPLVGMWIRRNFPLPRMRRLSGI